MRSFFKIVIICLFTLFIFENKVEAKELPLKNKIVVIDPGHGGFDNGAIEYGYNEDEINLSV